MVLSQLSYSPTCAQESILADSTPRCQSAHARALIVPPALTIKFFSVLPINSIEKISASRRNHAPYPVAMEKIFAVEKTDRRKQRGEEITPSDGIPSTFPSRSVAHVCGGIHAGQGLAPRALAPDCDSLLTEKPFFGYSKPSPRD